MSRRLSARWLIPLTVVVLLLPACSDSADDSADTTLGATTTSATIAGPGKALDNGDFETGDLTGWTTKSYVRSQFGGWFAYEDGETPPTDDSRVYAYNAFEVSDPPQGRYAAVADGNSEGLRVLYQDFTVSGPSVLHVTVFYRTVSSYGQAHIIAPNDLSTEPPNQQFRVDLIDPEAPILTVADEDVLATVFRTAEGDPVSLEPTEVTYDLSPWDGQTIRLRFAEVDNQGPFFAGVDDVRIEPTN